MVKHGTREKIKKTRFKQKDLGPDLLTAYASANPLLALKNYCWDSLKTDLLKRVFFTKDALKTRGLSCVCG